MSNKSDDERTEKQLKKAYELSFQDSKSKFIAVISKTKKNKLRIKILDNSEFHLTYMSDFSYKDLQKISKFFWLFKDIDSIINEMDNLFLDEKVLLTLDLEHNIVMKFQVELNTRNSFVLLKIENRDANKMKEMGKIFALVEEQKGVIQELNMENRKLKKQIEKNKYRKDNNSEEEEEEEEENEKSSKAKDKTKSSFVPQNGSLYDKKRIRPKIDRREEEKKEKEKDESEDISPKKEEKNEDDNKEEEKKEEEKEDINKDIEDEQEVDENLKSDVQKDREIEESMYNHQQKRALILNNINYQLELPKLVKKSYIFKEEREIKFLIDKINHNLNYRNKQFFYMRLIYRASEDGDTPHKFHRLCDGLSPLIVLIKTTYNKRFGGFTEAHFEASNELIGKKSNTSFIFNLDREKAYDIIEGQNAICCHKNYGPVFYGYEYCNIYLVGNFLSNEGNVARKGDRFKTTMDYEINDGKQKFVASEIEIYHVTLTNS